MADRIIKPDSGNNLVLQDEGGSAALTIETDGDVNLTQDIYLASGKGIYFDGGTGTANYLGGSDAYETGTFTPTFEPATNSFTALNPDSSTIGLYTKIGNLVNVSGVIYTDYLSKGSASGSVRLGGLPFNVSNDSSPENSFSGVIGYSSAWAGDAPSHLLARRTENKASMHYRASAGGASTSIDVSDLGTGANNNVTYFSLTYRTA